LKSSLIKRPDTLKSFQLPIFSGGYFMKAAISTDAGVVSQHFGRCPTFTIVEIRDGEVIERQEINNPGHQPGLIPQFLNERGVECIVAGGMGRRAMDLFEGFGIRTIVGITENVDETIEKLSRGELKSLESICQPGSGKGYGVEKDTCDHGEHED
jgi:predicted Fe-Mo cluster-binding NifX family protein